MPPALPIPDLTYLHYPKLTCLLLAFKLIFSTLLSLALAWPAIPLFHYPFLTYHTLFSHALLCPNLNHTSFPSPTFLSLAQTCPTSFLPMPKSTLPFPNLTYPSLPFLSPPLLSPPSILPVTPDQPTSPQDTFPSVLWVTLMYNLLSDYVCKMRRQEFYSKCSWVLLSYKFISFPYPTTSYTFLILQVDIPSLSYKLLCLLFMVY